MAKVSEPHRHDPVTALSESAATGRIAEIFADIRDVMQLPLITSVWRSLAGIEDGLESTWEAVRPIMLSGMPDRGLAELKQADQFLQPEQRFSGHSVSSDDVKSALAVMDAYNRSNTLNQFAITALVSGSKPGLPVGELGASVEAWPKLPRLMEKDEIDPATWSLLERVKFLGATNDSPVIATLWRHLAHWPSLLTEILDVYEPLQADGSVDIAVHRNFGQVAGLVDRMEVLDIDTSRIPAAALRMTAGYVNDPGAVNHMVTLGHSVRNWVAAAG